MAIRLIPHLANPLYPLPPDYWELTEKGMREARVNAARQWMHPDLTQEEKGHALVESCRFFDHWYLKDDPEENFYPMFYRKGFVPSPQFHWDIVSGWATEQLSLAVCPRGSAKSTLAEKVSIMELITAPGWEIVYATNNHENAKKRGYNIRYQCYDNQRIFDDWGQEYGKLRPTRGDAPTGIEMFFLSNNSSLRTVSAQSGLRGGRPNVFCLDDPENDERASTSMALVRAYMERLLFGIIAPMVMQPGCSVRWLATFVSKRHYAFSAMDLVEGIDGVLRARDPRFDYWYRMLVRAGYEKEGGGVVSCWREMWPATIAEKLADPKLARRVSLEEIEKRIGRHRYYTEYLGKPGESDDSFFKLDEKLHGYELIGVDEAYATNPRQSSTKVRYTHQGELKEMPICDLLKESRMLIPCDTSYTATTTSDYKACGLFVLTSDNILFLFDLWAGKKHEDALVKATFQMADRWKCPLIRPETVKQSYSLYLTMKHLVETRATGLVSGGFAPRVVPFKPPTTLDKSSKIASLAVRFEHGLIKIPMSMKGNFPWSMLVEQIDGFNPDVDNGGLQHDDVLDLCSMAQMCFEGKPSRLGYDRVADLSPIEKLKKGILREDTGDSIIHGLNLQDISLADVFEILEKVESNRTTHGTRI